MKIAFVQLGSWGDCLNSTMMLPPLRAKWPNSVIDFHVTSPYASAIENNPHVDHVIIHPSASKDQTFSLYDVIPKQLIGYDKVLVPAPILYGGKWSSDKHPELGYNLWCTFLRVLEELDVPYELPLKTTLRLHQHEITRAIEFHNANHKNRSMVLMETHGESGQTHWNDDWTIKVGEYLLRQGFGLYVSRRDVTAGMEHLQRLGSVNVCSLSLRECSELFNHCIGFISVSSGLCNACNASHCRTDGKWFESVNSDAVNSAPLRRTGKHFWTANDLDGFIKLLSDNGL